MVACAWGFLLGCGTGVGTARGIGVERWWPHGWGPHSAWVMGEGHLNMPYYFALPRRMTLGEGLCFVFRSRPELSLTVSGVFGVGEGYWSIGWGRGVGMEELIL